MVKYAAYRFIALVYCHYVRRCACTSPLEELISVSHLIDKPLISYFTISPYRTCENVVYHEVTAVLYIRRALL